MGQIRHGCAATTQAKRYHYDTHSQLKASGQKPESQGIPIGVDLCFILYGRMDDVSTIARRVARAVSEAG